MIAYANDADEANKPEMPSAAVKSSGVNMTVYCMCLSLAHVLTELHLHKFICANSARKV